MKMSRCEDVKMRRCEGEKMRQTPTIGRTLRSDALGKKGTSKASHFVVKLPGPMEDSLKLERLHFAIVSPLGFWKTWSML